jgi:hypothetical protein
MVKQLGLRITREFKILDSYERLREAGFSKVSGTADFLIWRSSKSMSSALAVLEVKKTLPKFIDANSLTSEERQLLSILLVAQHRSHHSVVGALTDLYNGWIFYWWERNGDDGMLKFCTTKKMSSVSGIRFLRCILALYCTLPPTKTSPPLIRFKRDDGDEDGSSGGAHGDDVIDFCLHRPDKRRRRRSQIEGTRKEEYKETR